MKHRWIFALLTSLAVGTANGQASPGIQEKINQANEKFFAAEQKISDTVCRSMIAAEKGRILAYSDIQRTIPKDGAADIERLKKAIAIGNDKIAEYQKCLDEHKAVLVVAPDDADYKVADRAIKDARAVGLPPSNPAIGMSEAECDAIESRRGWAKKVVDVTNDSKIIEYDGQEVMPNTHSTDKDTCRFDGGKLTEYAPVRIFP